MSRFSQGLVAAARSTKGITTGVPTAPVRTRWAEIHETARRGAAVLSEAGVQSGSAVAILAGLPIDVAPAAQAVWLAGGSVTMLHQPTARTDLARYAAETLAVLTMIGARVVIVGEPFTSVAEMLSGSGFVTVTADSMRAGEASAEPVHASEDATALLQLTSGSTATPKAVQITHRNLWANISAMSQAAEIDPEREVMVSWLPLFHDMGMVGFLTLPMCRGIELVKATPTDFLRSPLMWLELISSYRGTITAAPDFAYALAARVLPRAEGLDLTSLRFALDGAEPIDVSAARAFLAAGEPFGLRGTAVVPAYGMAEATLGISFHQWGTPLAIDTVDAAALEESDRAIPITADDADRAARGAEQSIEIGATADLSGSEPAPPANGALPGEAHPVRQFPLLGRPLPGIEVEVRTSDGTRCGDREVGTIMLRGESITERYVTVDGPSPTRGADGWLDTGDLGYLVDGVVVVCGRAKDVIIMGGRNIYPTDIERVAQTVPGVRAGNVAAVRIDAGARRETFAVIVESRSADDEVENARITTEVRAAVTSRIGVRPSLVVVVPAGSLPKTPSGKIRRSAAAALLPK
ncbi:MAG: long-chain fatty acid--CoA ligase [Actinobacteria bacterium 69-20]|nr:fatty acyl-AMP ligase [Actinomycetota bacterium]OJV27965.1 MAG: long-chain fatty acid--CoA ligase [Actinobacteria bacterium 69-20]